MTIHYHTRHLKPCHYSLVGNRQADVCDYEAEAGSSSPGSVSKLWQHESIAACAGVCRAAPKPRPGGVDYRCVLCVALLRLTHLN